MSPALKSKSKDRLSGKAMREQQKASLKPSPSLANGGNVPVSAYNPASGTFHSLDSAPVAALLSPQSNIWFQTVDETADHSGSSLGTATDYDSVSNNDSCSGESDDPKDKLTISTAARSESIPGSDTDKRDKIRQKNERKHQRQREKRAQELHERCSGYLMSSKLEALSQQLVAMGFPAERATMALILNEGRVEDSVSWLFEGGSEGKQDNTLNIDGGYNLKIDISEELARITEMEIKFKCSKQEVERAIVSCEGDLEKAADVMKAQRQEIPAAAQKLENSGDCVLVNGVTKITPSIQTPVTRLQGKPAVAVTIQQPREDKDANHCKVVITGVSLPENGVRNAQISKGMQSKLDWTRQQAAAQVESRWPNGSPTPSVSDPLALPLHAAVLPAKAEAHFVLGSGESKNISNTGVLREPVIMMQRPQSINIKQNLAPMCASISTSPPVNAGWYPNGASNIEIMRNLEQNMGRIGLSRNYGPSQSFYQPSHHQSSVTNLMDNAAAMWGSASSLGWCSPGSHLFGSSSAADWCMDGTMPQFDYTSIDWSHDLKPCRRNSSASLKTDRLHETWSTAFMGARTVKPGYNGICVAGVEDGGLSLNNFPSSMGSQEWTSPFTGNDLLRVPRQSVTSPPLQEGGF